MEYYTAIKCDKCMIGIQLYLLLRHISFLVLVSVLTTLIINYVICNVGLLYLYAHNWQFIHVRYKNKAGKVITCIFENTEM